MVRETLIAIATFTNISLSSLGVATPSSNIAKEEVLAKQELNLTNRIPNYPYGNQIFADNILLSLHYLKGDVWDDKEKDIDWEKIRQPFEVSFTLNPGEAFAFHNNLLPRYKDSVVLTGNSRFFVEDGYKSLNGLGGNGVCHLASLINWAAKEAGLESISFVNHDFSPVPGVPREYGASIFYTQDSGANSQMQNLYVKNNFEEPVEFEFKVDEKKVILTVSK